MAKIVTDIFDEPKQIDIPNIQAKSASIPIIEEVSSMEATSPREKLLTNSRHIFDQCLDKLDKKGQDYATEEDPFSSFSEFGQDEILDALKHKAGQKWSRFKNLVKGKKPMVADESIEDTVQDMINYLVLWLVRRQWK